MIFHRVRTLSSITRQFDISLLRCYIARSQRNFPALALLLAINWPERRARRAIRIAQTRLPNDLANESRPRVTQRAPAAHGPIVRVTGEPLDKCGFRERYSRRVASLQIFTFLPRTMPIHNAVLRRMTNPCE